MVGSTALGELGSIKQLAHNSVNTQARSQLRFSVWLLSPWLRAHLKALQVILTQGPCSWNEWRVLTVSSSLQLRPQETVTRPVCSLLGVGQTQGPPHQARTPWGQRMEARRLCRQPRGSCVGEAPAWLLQACHLLKMLNNFEQVLEFSFCTEPSKLHGRWWVDGICCPAGSHTVGPCSRVRLTTPSPALHFLPGAQLCPEVDVAGCSSFLPRAWCGSQEGTRLMPFSLY